MSNRLDIPTRLKLIRAGYWILTYNYKGILQYTEENGWVVLKPHIGKVNTEDYKSVLDHLKSLESLSNVIFINR